MIAAYPLQWPPAFPRTTARDKGKFQTSLGGALKNVEKSLQMFANDSDTPLHDIVISSNVTLGVMKPEDPGVSVWFTWEGMQVCIPVDRYASVEGNLQAIHHIIEARRVELRHGSLSLVKATFQGFLALPAPSKKHWREIMDMPTSTHPTPTIAEVKGRHKRLASIRHPDKGGSHAAMTELNQAWADAQRELGN